MDAFDSIHTVPSQWLRNSALAPFVPAHWWRLVERRYAPNTARMYLSCIAHFARWSRHRRLDLGHLDQHERSFLEEHLPRCACPYPAQRSRHQILAALQHLHVVLAEAGVEPEGPRVDPIGVELRRFDEHMQQAKGLSESTRHSRLAVIRTLIGHTASATPTADELRHFIAQEIARTSPASAGVSATPERRDADRSPDQVPQVAKPATAHERRSGLVRLPRGARPIR